MKLLVSNFDPLATTNQTYYECWGRLFQQSDCLNIAVGYASNDSVLYLKSLLDWNEPRRLNLCVGMAISEGLFKSQINALSQLDNLLNEKELGGVFFADQFPFHGKIQSFQKSSKYIGGLLGSSNLSNIVPPKGIYRGNYEVDYLIEEELKVKEIDSFIVDLITDGCLPFEAAKSRIKSKPDSNPILEGRFDVELVSVEKLSTVRSHLTEDRFEIPLKGTPKSNMNVFFGKGRDNNRGFVAPRPWYEVEIIPGLQVMRSANNYPQKEQFIVYTDDQYKFVLYTGGENNKNLRSRDDLTTVGRWLKGRLEMTGALESGQIVDDEVFLKYGRNSMTLIRSTLTEFDVLTGRELQVWFADFGQK